MFFLFKLQIFKSLDWRFEEFFKMKPVLCPDSLEIFPASDPEGAHDSDLRAFISGKRPFDECTYVAVNQIADIFIFLVFKEKFRK